jgi:hypothetical protein
MSSPVSFPEFAVPAPAPEETVLQEVLGYLNFSNGKPDPRFQAHLSRLAADLVLTPAPSDNAAAPPPAAPQHAALPFPSDSDDDALAPESGDVPAAPAPSLGDPRLIPLVPKLLAALDRLERESPVFRDTRQARAVIHLAFGDVLSAYRAHHSDLLFHVEPQGLVQPFFMARLFEATLAQGGPWTDTARILPGALRTLNDFLGHRPVAVLENGRKMEPYPHERFRPIPIYLRGAGVAAGRYAAVVSQALSLLANTPEEIRRSAWFNLDHLDELAVDVRAFDHSHPVYKRTNYTFGEWDPHLIDTKGDYRRFVVRTIILEALLEWMKTATDLTVDEQILEAGAVLAGTILMASAVSGEGPDTHDSSISLTTLLPRIARQRDAFYQRLLQSLQGPHADRLRKEAEVNQQPLGRIRQHLNLHLAHYGCRQMQRTHLAEMYARMGYSDAARDQALIIPSASARFETELHWRITHAHHQIRQGQLDAASALAVEMESLLDRGINCGAFVDPWNILAFQGQFPLFRAREDSVADQRIERLLDLVEGLFGVYSRLMCEAAAAGRADLVTAAGARFRDRADQWDKYATSVVSDLPEVKGREAYDSAVEVSEALLAWNRAGEAAGDVAFWKQYVDRLNTAKAYAIVVDVLLGRGDVIAAMNLLLQWLSETEGSWDDTADGVPLEDGPYSFHALARRWIRLCAPRPDVHHAPGAAAPLDPERAWQLVRRMLDGLEVNAGPYWNVPTFSALSLPPTTSKPTSDPFDSDGPPEPGLVEPDDDHDGDDDREDLFHAAYENVVFRDSAQDGNVGDTLDDGIEKSDTLMDRVTDVLEDRLRFFQTLTDCWREAAVFALRFERQGTAPTGLNNDRDETLGRWRKHNEQLFADLATLVESLAAYEPNAPSGDPDSMLDYDRELHLKFGLLNQVIATQSAATETSRLLAACRPESDQAPAPKSLEQILVALTRAALLGRRNNVRTLFPKLVRHLERRPLLYVPLDKDGSPRDVLAARNLQQTLRFWLARLPRLGLFRETSELLKVAFRMERTSPPAGMSITEFDRLTQTALRATVEAFLDSADHWDPADADAANIVDLLSQVADHFEGLWLKHSKTMRLSSLEALHDEGIRDDVRDFISEFGQELFYPQVLTLGNLRAIIHRGAPWYIEYLQRSDDPLQSRKFLDHIEEFPDDLDGLGDTLELIFRCLVEKFDRFMEYNSTTTQSDYGEQLFCLIDFLRLESQYERDAWNIFPQVVVHEVLCRKGRGRAAHLWERQLRQRMKSAADKHLRALKKLEKEHSIRLPSITDRLGEKFVKPLALDRIRALVMPAMREARGEEPPKGKSSFTLLARDVEKYLATSLGSALELQPWLQSLTDEVEDCEALLDQQWGPTETPGEFPHLKLSFKEFVAQLDQWDRPLNEDD